MRIATVLARKGSKGLPGKNAIMIGGEPLLVRTIRQALRTNLFDAVVVSSDSGDLLRMAEDEGAETVHRPPALATDEITKLPGIRHAVEHCEAKGNRRFRTVADLAVTSPLRSDADIAGAVELLETSGAPLVLSARPASDNPYFNILEPAPSGNFVLSKTVAGGIGARQAAPPCYALNGAVYVWRREELARADDTVVRAGARLQLMSRENSIDIDDLLDLEIAEFLLQRTQARKENLSEC